MSWIHFEPAIIVAGMLEALIRDTRYAARALVARPTYAVLTITTLALVIGAATAVIAVVNATMFRPLPFPAGDRIVKLFTMPPGTSRVTERNPLHPRSTRREARDCRKAVSHQMATFWSLRASRDSIVYVITRRRALRQ